MAPGFWLPLLASGRLLASGHQLVPRSVSSDSGSQQPLIGCSFPERQISQAVTLSASGSRQLASKYVLIEYVSGHFNTGIRFGLTVQTPVVSFTG
jgi:hypothetical protein